MINDTYPDELIERLGVHMLSLVKCCFAVVLSTNYYFPLMLTLEHLTMGSKNEYISMCYAESLYWKNDLFQLDPLLHNINELKKLCRLFPIDCGYSYEPLFFIMRFYCHSLARLSSIYAWNDMQQCCTIASELKEIYESYPVFDFALPYAEAVHNEHLAELQSSDNIITDRCNAINSIIYDIFIKQDMNEAILNLYGRILLNEINAADTLPAVERKVVLEKLFYTLKSELSALHYAKALHTLVLKLNDDVDKEEVLRDLYILHVTFPNNYEIKDSLIRATGAFRESKKIPES